MNRRFPASPGCALSCARIAMLALAFTAQFVPRVAVAIDLPRESRVPGGIALLNLGASDEPPGTVQLGGYFAPVLETAAGWVAVVGIPLDTKPGPVQAKLQPPQGAARELAFTVTAKKYDEQHLKVANQRHVDPNQDDLDFARRAGIAPGGDVVLHGLPDGERWVGDVHRGYDWTNGCIAVTDDEMSEIWGLVDDGTPIEIRP